MEDFFNTTHRIYYSDSRDMNQLESDSINLIVTSPPYPMIEMWDEIFNSMNGRIGDELNKGNSTVAFELMHKELYRVWNECYRVLKDGGIMCINIGDATRTIKNNFQLFSNHSKILNHCIELGFQNLPNIIWRKTTNAPNKYMGSGMLPVGAYVTLEHEYILVLRKGIKREFKSDKEKKNRRASAFFWEERNSWFSDVWLNMTGVTQKLNNTELRNRSGAFPIELAHRLINMYSVYEDTILDPFDGTGTTTIASLVNGRNSVGYEIDHKFQPLIELWIKNSKNIAESMLKNRINKHFEFVKEREEKKEIKFTNKNYDLKCVSNQEVELRFYLISEIEKSNDSFIAKHKYLNKEKFEELISKKIRYVNNKSPLLIKESENQIKLL